jgi:putative nucleotidyltransferase with HDIG domain
MDYVSIRVSTLRGDQKIEFNAYLKINDKMILYVRRGDSFDQERLQRFKDKKVRKLFILNDEENKYREYLQKNIEMAYDDHSGKDIVTRAQIIQGQLQSNVEEVFEDSTNVESYNIAKDDAARFVHFVISNSKAAGALLNIANDDANIAHHGVTVSTLAVALAQKLNITDPKKLQMLAMGALLHDFGHIEMPLQLARPLADFTQEEIALYRRHAQNGADQVQDKKHFDQNVVNIIAQHEECTDGSGFPKGARESEIDPLAIIVGTANALDRLMTFEQVPRATAVKKLMIEQVGKHPLNQIQFLGEILKAT